MQLVSQKVSIINVSNRLPVTIREGKVRKSSGGLVAALEGIDHERYTLRWLGWPGGAIPTDQQKEIAQTLDHDFGCTPIFLDPHDMRGHYDGLSNGSLWPLLHYMPGQFTYEPWWWDAYERVNQQFAETVLSVAQDDDLVWVHDYQLMLLPRLLREARPSLRVGFFLHTPFPSQEVFRCHPNRVELLNGVLGANLVGFHTFGYLRHFRSAVSRLVGVDPDFMDIRHDGGRTRLGVHPIGINAPAFERQVATADHLERQQRFHHTFDGKRLVLSVERLDYSKGLLQRLEAIDLFLSESDPTMRDTTKFIFVSVPSRENVGAYRVLREDVEAAIGRINGKYTTLVNSPVHFIHGTVDFGELAALYASAEVALVTPLVDGMNLVAKEYVACQTRSPGVLVLSEFAGAAQELFSALIVNPYDAKAVAGALTQALAMPHEERQTRMRAMRERVMQHDAGEWARRFIDALRSSPAADRGVPHASQIMDRLVDVVRTKRRLALFLDYDGSLREIERTPDAARPHAELIELLDRLDARSDIETTIISGRSAGDLKAFIGHYTQLGLIAEHGAMLRAPGASDWQDRQTELDLRWRDDVRPVLDLHAQSTPGCFVEEKGTSLVWHYRRADPEFGKWKAVELLSELSTMLANMPVSVRHGRKIVEITPQQISKGAAVMQVQSQRHADLVVVVGDDATDESMFELPDEQIVSIKIGAGDTRAAYQLPTPAALRTFLMRLLDAI